MTEHIPEYLASHAVHGDRLDFNLTDELKLLRSDLERGGRKAVTLSKNHGTSVVLIALAQGNHIADHQAPGAISIQVLDGLVRLVASGQSQTAPAGTLMVLGPGSVHSLEAEADSAILLTISPPT
jgi:quercetin dioxygenase-like cupin family protein